MDCIIPTEEIEKDILDTQAEINQYQEEINTLMHNLSENKLEVYLRQGKIGLRENLIKEK